MTGRGAFFLSVIIFAAGGAYPPSAEAMHAISGAVSRMPLAPDSLRIWRAQLAPGGVSCGTEAFAMYQKGEDYKDGADDKIAKGLDGRADYAIAVYCIGKSAEAGSPLAAAWLAAAYRDGTAYLPRDQGLSRQWACRAIQLGWGVRDSAHSMIYTPPGGTGGDLDLRATCQGG